jgi:hypothetical protein
LRLHIQGAASVGPTPPAKIRDGAARVTAPIADERFVPV